MPPASAAAARLAPPAGPRLNQAPPPPTAQLLQETFFGVLFYIYTNRYLPTDWRYVGLAVALQWVQLLILFFGPTFGWDIDWQGNRCD